MATECAALEAEILLASVLGKDRSYLFTWPEMVVDNTDITSFRQLVEQRRNGKPIAYILGSQEFWSLPLKVTPDTLIPRPETEQLVDAVLNDYSSKDKLFVLDTGTGTGAIALALAKERPLWNVFASDYSFAALSVAVHNSQSFHIPLHLFCGDWLSAVTSNVFDIVISNPPYIATGDIHLPALAYEPESALVALDDGFADINVITSQASQVLKSGGRLYIEHGHHQGNVVNKRFIEAGFVEVSTRKDYASCDRFTCGVKL